MNADYFQFMLLPNNWLDYLLLLTISVDITTLTKLKKFRTAWKVLFIVYMICMLAIPLYGLFFFFGWIIPGFNNYDVLFGSNMLFAPVRFVIDTAGFHIHYLLLLVAYLIFVGTSNKRKQHIINPKH